MGVVGAIGFEARVPAALGFSIALHAVGLAVFLIMTEKASREAVQQIDDVMLMDQEQEKERPKAQAGSRPPAPSLKDFLKLALPARPAALKTLEAQLPERKLMDLAEKLEDRGRKSFEPKLAALDLGRKRVDLAKIAEPLAERRSSAVEALPKLEEVGFRRAAPKVLALAALAEENRRKAPIGGLADLSATLGRRSRSSEAAPLLAPEADGAKPRSALDRLGGLLPEKTRLRERIQEAPEAPPLKALASIDRTAALPARREPRGLDEPAPKKKAVEIEGPLSGRKVVEHSVPEFPQWAREAGIVEADVAIKFFVDPLGTVLEDRITIERPSGYGRLDRLAVEHLKRWRFESMPLGARNEWGIITFRFLLE